ncbi:het domain-containing protein [Echria macrotheca]|uniref:Het domain-containing protein n=1 Tax=Echria macrotheca TaxID=438768 RepID=A0AAJ0BIU8_9PEZI|nr:het domain-containing protein [Echria macrotheca]
MVCNICGDFQGLGPFRDDPELDPLEEPRHWIKADLRWDELLGSADSCFICSVLVSGSRACFEQHCVDEREIDNFGVYFYYRDSPDDDSEPDKQLRFRLENGQRFEIEMFATEVDEDCLIPEAWESIPVFQRTSPQTDSEAALATARGWLEECLRPADEWEPSSDEDSENTMAHEFCSSPENPMLPSRVIDVGSGDGAIRLVETHGARGLYLCLSHCWGKTQIITTTQSTLDQRLAGIPLEALSNTFRDAIMFTRQLGVRYIWIDSLCIIQDSLQDWEIESAKMSEIYSNAHLTIAATHSHDGRGGLFHTTPDIHLTGTTPDGEPYKLYFRERIDHHLEDVEDPGDVGHPTSEHYPLLTRAWVYQERMLSTRVLHFGYYELWYECRSLLECECGGIGVNSSADSPAPITKRLHADALDSVIPGHDWQVVARYYIARLWRTMVSTYVCLGITKMSDRLPAMAGLAKHMAARRKSRYFAGLWQDEMSDDLLWSVYIPKDQKKGRPSPLTAPTWSWASVQTHVLYTDEIIYFNKFASYNEGARDPTSFEHFASVESCEVTPAAVDEYGAVKAGLLRVKGLVVEGQLSDDDHVMFPGGFRFPFLSDYSLDQPGPYQCLPGTKVSCMRMSRLLSSGRHFFLWLVLKPAGDAFERIGTIRHAAEGQSRVDPLHGVYDLASERTVSVC